MRQALRMMSWTGALVFGGGLGLGPPPARAQEYLYGDSLYPAPGSVSQGPGYYTYDYYPAPGYLFPAPGYFYPPGFHYPVLRYSDGAPMGYAPVPRYSFPAPWYGGLLSGAVVHRQLPTGQGGHDSEDETAGHIRIEDRSSMAEPGA